jgi:tetratricopeptide (TPR) repeat protein
MLTIRVLILWFIMITVSPCRASPEVHAEVEKALQLNSHHHPHEAILHLNHAIQMDPNAFNAHLQRANALVQLDELTPALSDLDIVLKHGDNDFAYELRSRVMYELGNYEQALADISSSIEHTTRPWLKSGRLYQRSRLYRVVKQPDKALPDLAAALALEKKPTKNFYYNRGGTYFEMGEYKKAVADFTSAIDLVKPGDIERSRYYGLRASAYQKMGRTDLAAADRNKSDETTENAVDEGPETNKKRFSAPVPTPSKNEK